MKLPDQMVGLAEDIIDKMTGEFEPEQVRRPLRECDDRTHPLQAGGIAGTKEKPPRVPLTWST